MAEMDGWVEFDRTQFKRGRQRNPAAVTLRARGDLVLNQAAMDALGNPPRVRLLFQPERRAIGIRAAAANDERAFPVSKSGLVKAEAFAEHYVISLASDLRYRAVVDGDMLVFDLTEAPE